MPPVERDNLKTLLGSSFRTYFYFLSFKVHCTEVNVDLFLDKRLVIMVEQDVISDGGLLS